MGPKGKASLLLEVLSPNCTGVTGAGAEAAAEAGEAASKATEAGSTAKRRSHWGAVRALAEEGVAEELLPGGRAVEAARRRGQSGAEEKCLARLEGEAEQASLGLAEEGAVAAA